jgi:uncharacterized protein involved in cysteine biosynthesis
VIRGFTALFRALPMIFGDRRLLALFILPAVITLVASFAAGFEMLYWGQKWYGRWHLGGIGSALAFVVVLVASLAATWLAYLLVGLIATAPFGDAISERAEELAGTPRPPRRPFHYVFISLFHTLALVALYLAIAIPLFLVNWLAPVAAPVAALIGLLVTAFFFAWDAFDPALSRRGRSFAEKWRFFGEHRAETLGLGLAATLASAIPFAGVIVPPLAVAAAARLFAELMPR